VQALLLWLIGLIILRISLDDLYLRFVRPVMRPYLVAAGAFLVLLGFANLLIDHDEEHERDGHGHRSRAGWLLLVPVTALVLVLPPALGAGAAARSRPPAFPEGSAGLPALPVGRTVSVTFLGYVRRATEAPGTLAGRTVRLEGFVTPRRAGGYYLTRMVITCCAADAAAVKIATLGPRAGGYAANTWLQVTGRYVPGTDGDPDELITRLQAADVRRIRPPHNPYDH
jgi:uncharacterized repeat protein (TIGR03943 family)